LGLPFDGVVELVFHCAEKLCFEARSAGAVVGVGVAWDLAVFFGRWEVVEADGAGPVFGLGCGCHDACFE